MSKCEHCPMREGVCKAEVDSRYSFFCGQAASGEPSQLLAIRLTSGAMPVAKAEVVVEPEPVVTTSTTTSITTSSKRSGGCGSCGERRRRLKEEAERRAAEAERRAEVRERLQ